MSSIFVCSNCGKNLGDKIDDGVIICPFCNTVIYNTLKNRLLSAAWMLRKKTSTIEKIKIDMKLDQDEANFVQSFVEDHLYGHEEFKKMLTKFGVN
jgi:predicted RNA-binding Zn-ribbon protein involved in translation (DUF1610 family)